MLCHDRGSRRAVEELHKELVLSQEELTQLNAVLETKLPEEDVGRYQRELDERATACFKRIDEYAQLRAGQDPSIIIGRSRAGSDYTRASSRSWARSRRNLLEATKRRELAGLQLAQEKRAEQLHARTIAFENELERLQLQERQAAREATDQESEGNPDDVDLTIRSTSSSRRPAIGRAASSFGVGRKQSHFAKQSTPALLSASTPAPPPTSAPISNDGDQRADAWIDHTTDEWNQIPQRNGLAACLPKVKLNKFDGNPPNWHDFIGTFKAYCHDVTPIPAQRMQVLKSYLSPRVRSTIAQYLRNPKRYPEALQVLHQRYGDPEMIDRAHVAELMSMPAIRNNSQESLTVFSARLRDCITALETGSCHLELDSVVSLDRTLTKIPVELRMLWDHHRVSLKHRTILRDLDLWLETKREKLW